MTRSKTTYEYTKTLKAKITTSKPHFVQKVTQYRSSIVDAFNTRFRSIITIFIPKLKVNYTKPCVMCHIQNGNGSVLIRAKSPDELAELFTDLVNQLKSDKWFELWSAISDYSNDVYENGNLLLDDKFIDTQDIERELDETPIITNQSKSSF